MWWRLSNTSSDCEYELFDKIATPTLSKLTSYDRINLEPEQIISRLWPKFDLDPNYEKLLLSN